MKDENLIIVLITIYDFVSDFVDNIAKDLEFCIERPGRGNPPIKTTKLSVAEIITLGLFRYFMGYSNWKAYYRFIRDYHGQDFPDLPDYKSFVENMNKASFISLILLQYFMEIFRKNTPDETLKFADSTKLEVCNIKRELSHKVTQRIAAKSKSSMGWFYGFKLHIVCNEYMQILNFRLTAGNIDDREGLAMMWNEIFGMIIADAGYVGKDWQQKARDNGVILMAAVRANMRKLMTKAQHTLFRMRQRVEIVFSVLKHRMGLQTSLPRSEAGHFAHYILCVTAYQLNKFFQLTLNHKSLT